MSSGEVYLMVYSNRSELVEESGETKIFEEGSVSSETEKRTAIIKKTLSNGFLERRILECRKGIEINIDPEHKQFLDSIVDAVTGQRGRAIVGVTILQCCIKCIVPEQDIRLHKGGNNRRDFSWVDGIPMRSIDKPFITPVLRKYDLLKLNADGFMMTRTLAENYPYSKVYKAQIRGARDQWLIVVDLLEKMELNAGNALNYLLSRLINKSDEFHALADHVVAAVQLKVKEGISFPEIYKIIEKLIDSSNYAARVFEIALHSLYQVFDANGEFEYELKPLTQMRSANLKHGNIGDIEIIESKGVVSRTLCI
jgi:hypothetical protein